MGKMRVKGCAFDKPGPKYPFLSDMRTEGKRRALLSESVKVDREKAIFKMIALEDRLGDCASKRFTSDTRAALRRAKDGPAATPCSRWAAFGCTKCKTKRVGDSHHIFCKRRETFKHEYEQVLADALKREILSYHRDHSQAMLEELPAIDPAAPTPALVGEGSSSSLAAAAPGGVDGPDEERAPPLSSARSATLRAGTCRT